MALPFLLIPLAAKAIAAAKVTFAAGKGAAIAAKAVGGKSALGKLVMGSAHTFGWSNTIAASAVGAITIGTAAGLWRRGRNLCRALDNGDLVEAVPLAVEMAAACRGHDALDDAHDLLHEFAADGGDDCEVVARTREMLDALLTALGRRIDAD